VVLVFEIQLLQPSLLKVLLSSACILGAELAVLSPMNDLIPELAFESIDGGG
jgi:hypothetical protein